MTVPRCRQQRGTVTHSAAHDGPEDAAECRASNREVLAAADPAGIKFGLGRTVGLHETQEVSRDVDRVVERVRVSEAVLQRKVVLNVPSSCGLNSGRVEAASGVGFLGCIATSVICVYGP